jgi:DNA-binding response OmpR family regulator
VEIAEPPSPSPSPNPSSDGSWQVDHVTIRPEEFSVLVFGQRVNLTIREFELLAVLARRPDRILRREAIFSQVWGGSMPVRDRSTDVFVRKVRTKLRQASPDWRYVHTHFGIGYRFAPERAVRRSSDSATTPG